MTLDVMQGKLTYKNSEIMQNFGLSDVPSLDVCVLGCLELFSKHKFKKILVDKKKKTLVLGSGNALATGKIIFRDLDAIYANESDYKSKIDIAKIDIAFLVSASGSKSSIQIAKDLKRKKIRTVLLTNNEDAPALRFVDGFFLFPKQREPYTYNTSTYLSMIFSKTGENPKKIYAQIKKVDNYLKKYLRLLKNKNSFYFILPEKFELTREMFVTKFDELFGGKIVGRVYTNEQTKHAKTLVSSENEVFISMGKKNSLFGLKKNRIDIPLSKNANFAEFILVGYYVIGKIQGRKSDYFKKSLAKYCKEASRIFDQEINPIVE